MWWAHSVVLGVSVFLWAMPNTEHSSTSCAKGVNVNTCKLLARFTILSFSGMHLNAPSDLRRGGRARLRLHAVIGKGR